MEKRTPHTRLSTIKEIIRNGQVCITNTALISASQLGFCSKQEIIDVVIALSANDFYKSMTAYHDHTCWHEVYRPHYRGQSIYLKLIVSGSLLIVSFKEL